MPRNLPERFLVAFSFAGEQRNLVRAIAESLERELGDSNVFFDEWFEHYIAGNNADLRLQEIYGERCVLAVVCVSERYGTKPWTGAEHEAIRARLMRARGSANRTDELGILPIRVGDGDVPGVPFNAIVPDVRERSAEAIARLILDRLHLVLPSTRPFDPTRPSGSELVVERIESFELNKQCIREALTLYEERIPPDERYSLEQMVDLVRRHLSHEFGPTWKMHFLVAKFAAQVVGILICYEDIARNFAFISYLAARNPRCRGKNPPDVSEQLGRALVEARHRLGLQSPRFLFEVDDPALAKDPRERRRRIGRIRLFATLAPFESVHLRVLNIPYRQPRLEWPGTGHEKQLLLCYAAASLYSSLGKNEVVDILTWTYTELYSDDIFEDPSTRAQYSRHIRELLDSTIQALPESVGLLRYHDIIKHQRG